MNGLDHGPMGYRSAGITATRVVISRGTLMRVIITLFFAPNSEPLHDAATCALALQFDRSFSIPGRQDAGFDQCARGETVDLAMLVPGA